MNKQELIEKLEARHVADAVAAIVEGKVKEV
jgi:hypothetical protein